MFWSEIFEIKVVFSYRVLLLTHIFLCRTSLLVPTRLTEHSLHFVPPFLFSFCSLLHIKLRKGLS